MGGHFLGMNKAREYIMRQSNNVKRSDKTVLCGFVARFTANGSKRIDISLWENPDNFDMLREIEFEIKEVLTKRGYYLERKQQALRG